MPQTKHDPHLGQKKSKTMKSITSADPKSRTQAERKSNVVRSTGLKSRMCSKLPSQSTSRPSAERGYITPLSAEGKKVKKVKKAKKVKKVKKEKKEKKKENKENNKENKENNDNKDNKDNM